MSTVAITPGQERALETLMSLYERNGVTISQDRFNELLHDPALVQHEIRALLPKSRTADEADLAKRLGARVVEASQNDPEA